MGPEAGGGARGHSAGKRAVPPTRHGRACPSGTTTPAPLQSHEGDLPGIRTITRQMTEIRGAKSLAQGHTALSTGVSVWHLCTAGTLGSGLQSAQALLCIMQRRLAFLCGGPAALFTEYKWQPTFCILFWE